MVCSCRFTHLMPQSATFTPFRSPTPAISHFDLFDLRPEKCEKCLKFVSAIVYQIFIFSSNDSP